MWSVRRSIVGVDRHHLRATRTVRPRPEARLEIVRCCLERTTSTDQRVLSSCPSPRSRIRLSMEPVMAAAVPRTTVDGPAGPGRSLPREVRDCGAGQAKAGYDPGDAFVAAPIRCERAVVQRNADKAPGQRDMARRHVCQ
jgi:hypothetical protein